MSLSSVISLLIGILSVVLSFLLEGGKALALIERTAALTVFGGTIGAVGLSFPIEDIKRIPAIIKVAFGKQVSDTNKLIDYFKDIAIKTRKNGLLSIEEDISQSTNNLARKGLQMMVDGVEPQTIRNILELKAYSIFERHKSGIAMFEAAGGFSPTLGIIGTVMGLVHVLGNLSDPSSLGPKISVAFIATLYGVASANLIWLPIANKLKAYNKVENRQNELIIEGILSIQEGLSPNTLVEKLMSFTNENDVIDKTDADEKVKE